MATNRPDVLDPALMRPGRLDRKVEIPLPNEIARMEILKIHPSSLIKHGDIEYEAVVKLAENLNGADLRNLHIEAGMFAIRDERDYVVHEDFMKAARKLIDAKKLETAIAYDASWGDCGKNEVSQEQYFFKINSVQTKVVLESARNGSLRFLLNYESRV